MKRKVAILGATGAVGQRFIQLLQDHPWFQIEVLAASERSAGKKYRDACPWLMETELPKKIADMPVVNADVASVEQAGAVDLVFSSLPGDLAFPVEEQFGALYPVFSKASAHRMDKDVPLIIPEINPDHINMVKVQQNLRGWKGFITTDPNCSTIQLAITLKPLMQFGLKQVMVSTMQALSGAGYPGVASLDIIDNVIPFISGEEEKMETEALKILGKYNSGNVQNADFQLSASCNRVNVTDGHLESVFVKLEQNPTMEEIEEAFIKFQGEPQRLKLPSAPVNPIVVRHEKNRPQPRFDRDIGNGMSVIVGRIRKDPIMTFKYMCLGHNTLRGAAGGGILSAELYVSKGMA
ncbi:MAG: aspartate-semialdehyde dehydrogenase [Nitrososphaerota archaeon]|jgi:aspartate-semialdehyde dehydrogenase|uniref:aspartate-semialdehyde dehydrogenase n=1 Tax=Candidatus Bathycorpusculum sp. TaxID=2994959 RepID=UPI002817BEC0|nr:aspartate-semialdehyde dehydrogenase [Candidatus Termiticorpusculum sp.]MCL2257260.1 aspartate-semialdehyde dehydrogenase [Candidatus Termiticorpusculum sp.]MCL2292593.1 aspartate-semialdehyde dehydrogenase [Candidatus Termiticorpusculum sp.]MDR0460188.1 aspartate-semialdehyde dehydrogenase [Nitrososphaerota archaeon]